MNTKKFIMLVGVAVVGSIAAEYVKSKIKFQQEQ
jgi:hypothetical protein